MEKLAGHTKWGLIGSGEHMFNYQLNIAWSHTNFGMIILETLERILETMEKTGFSCENNETLLASKKL